jgi:surface antigen
MTKSLTFLLALLLSVVLIAGCAQHYNKPATGTLLGGAAGGALGSQFGHGAGKTIATVVGALGGAYLGRRIGEHMQQSDRQRFGNALESEPTGHTTTWTNPDTNERYSVTPTHTNTSGNQPCRQYKMQAQVNGQPKTITGTACRQPDGTWRTQS